MRPISARLFAASDILRGGLEREAFVDPSCDPTGHDLHWAAQLCEPQSTAGGAVAVRSGTISDEQGAVRPARHLGSDDLAVRQVDCARNVPRIEQGGAANVEQDEARLFGLQGVMNVP